jgi:hypothetical protein
MARPATGRVKIIAKNKLGPPLHCEVETVALPHWLELVAYFRNHSVTEDGRVLVLHRYSSFVVIKAYRGFGAGVLDFQECIDGILADSNVA